MNLNNARIASVLGLEMVIIASGGLGSACDELALNISLCKEYNVPIRGVILNRVLNDKRKMIEEYFPRSLARWNIPLIGCVPFNEFLNTPSMGDFENLFKTALISGEQHHWRHFRHVRMVAGSLEAYIEEIGDNELVITPASRDDIVEALVEKNRMILEETGKDLNGGLILTSRKPPGASLIALIQSSGIPCLYAPICSYDAMKFITSYIAKIQSKDTEKIRSAIHLVEKNLDFSKLCGKDLSAV
jgi:hypothetical protein